MLQTKKLSVLANNNLIVRDIDLTIKPSELHLVLGPNGSGKSTFCYGLMKIPNYKTRGKIYLNGIDISRRSLTYRARNGLAIAFQHPPTINGVKIKSLLNIISNDNKKIHELIDSFDLSKLLDREINKGFSGGEKKLFELIQVIAQRPKIAILDEIDSGIDISKLKPITKLISEELIDKGVGILMVTHNSEIIRMVNPFLTHIMLNGRIICSSPNWKPVWNTIRRYGYEKCKECELRSNKP